MLSLIFTKDEVRLLLPRLPDTEKWIGLPIAMRIDFESWSGYFVEYQFGGGGGTARKVAVGVVMAMGGGGDIR